MVIDEKRKDLAKEKEGKMKAYNYPKQASFTVYHLHVG